MKLIPGSKHFWKTVRWDGLVPLGAACIPSLLQWWFPRELFVIGLIAEFVSIGVAVFRAHVGFRQLQWKVDSPPSLGRQLLLVLAILLLLVFESFVVKLRPVGMAANIKDEISPLVYVAVALLYIAYFATALIAFKPSKTAAESC